jgi:hypothetical protein
VLGLIIWIFVPAREGSRWKRLGPFGREDPLAQAEVKQD